MSRIIKSMELKSHSGPLRAVDLLVVAQQELACY